MIATKAQIREWLERGRNDGATHVIIMCDTFSHGDYPVFVKHGQDPREIKRRIDDRDTHRFMECYALALPWESQLDEQRAHNFEMPPDVHETLADVEVFLRSTAHQLRVWYAHKEFHACIGLVEVTDSDSLINVVRAATAKFLSQKKGDY
jgi:hypothetical protein